MFKKTTKEKKKTKAAQKATAAVLATLTATLTAALTTSSPASATALYWAPLEYDLPIQGILTYDSVLDEVAVTTMGGTHLLENVGGGVRQGLIPFSYAPWDPSVGAVGRINMWASLRGGAFTYGFSPYPLDWEDITIHYEESVSSDTTIKGVEDEDSGRNYPGYWSPALYGQRGGVDYYPLQRYIGGFANYERHVAEVTSGYFWLYGSGWMGRSSQGFGWLTPDSYKGLGLGEEVSRAMWWQALYGSGGGFLNGFSPGGRAAMVLSNSQYVSSWSGGFPDTPTFFEYINGYPDATDRPFDNGVIRLRRRQAQKKQALLECWRAKKEGLGPNNVCVYHLCLYRDSIAQYERPECSDSNSQVICKNKLC